MEPRKRDGRKNGNAARSILIAVSILSPATWLTWKSASGSELVFMLFFACAIGSLSFLLWLVLEIVYYYRDLPTRRMIRTCFSVMLLFVVSVGTTHWPLRLSFSIWKTQLDEARIAIESGNAKLSPSRIGPFMVVRTEMMRDRWPALVLHDEPNGPIRLIFTRETKVGNTWSEIRLSEDWVLNAED